MFDINKLMLDAEEIQHLIVEAKEIIEFLETLIQHLSEGKDFYKVMQAYNIIDALSKSAKLLASFRHNSIALGRMLPELNDKQQPIIDWLEDDCPHPAFTTEKELQERERDKHRQNSLVDLIEKRVNELKNNPKDNDKQTTNLH